MTVSAENDAVRSASHPVLNWLHDFVKCAWQALPPLPDRGKE